MVKQVLFLATSITAQSGLHGQHFIRLNGGLQLKYSGSISLMINCDDQEEVAYFWQKLFYCGKTYWYGWLKEGLGPSWQVVPLALPKFLGNADAGKIKRETQAMLRMDKIFIKELESANQEN